MRQGPGPGYPPLWVYNRAGLPVQIVEERGTWRRVLDAEGVSGWVPSAQLSARRTALVRSAAPQGSAPQHISLYVSDSTNARTVALIESGVTADVHRCDGRWCEVTAGGFSGYIEQQKLWGVGPGETIR